MSATEAVGTLERLIGENPRGASAEAVAEAVPRILGLPPPPRDVMIRLMAACARAGRTDLLSTVIRHMAGAHYQVRVQNKSGLPWYILEVARAQPDVLTLLLSDDTPDTFFYIQAHWLADVMPLLDAVMTGDVFQPGTVQVNQWDAGVVPGLAYSASGDDYFLVPDPIFLRSHGYAGFREKISLSPPAWNERIAVAQWRGATTGQAPEGSRDWRALPRVKLSQLSLEHPLDIDAGITSIFHFNEPALEKEIEASGIMKPFVEDHMFQSHRYLIDIDGNSNAWAGLFTKLLTGSTVLKVASPQGFRQWYYDKLVAWVHYIPVLSDLSDLVEKIRWLRRRDEFAAQVGRNGRELALSMDYDTEVQRGVQTVNLALRVSR